MYLVKKLKKFSRKLKNSMPKPILLKTNDNGGTIHFYPVSGGKTTFYKYLTCLSGVCNFYDEYETAVSSLEKMT